MSRDVWSPEQYERYRDERSQPFFDLMALVEPAPGMRVVDLGCGTGELTALLHRQLGAFETLGIDNAPSMLAKSASFKQPGLRFELGDIEELPAEPTWDLIFSNAALQWVPDHERLLSRLTRRLNVGGQLAVQVPANHQHVSHTVAAQVAREEPFRQALDGYVRASPVLSPERYAALLDSLGFAHQHVRLQVYAHHLDSAEDVVEWVKGTLLTDYRRRLPEELYPSFLDRYRTELLPRLGEGSPFFYPFNRILFWGRRSA